MRYDPEAVAVAFQRLFRTYRFVEPSEADEMLRVYFEALVDYETRDIETGIHNMLAGRVDGFNPSFLPPAPLVAKSVRDAMLKRLETERLDRLQLPPPADDFVQDPPEVRAKNRAKLDALAASLASSMRMDDAPLRALQARTNARFDPPGYTVGDPDAETGDMGEREAS
jgi:hypothetical protein